MDSEALWPKIVAPSLVESLAKQVADALFSWKDAHVKFFVMEKVICWEDRFLAEVARNAKFTIPEIEIELFFPSLSPKNSLKWIKLFLGSLGLKLVIVLTNFILLIGVL